MTAGKGSGEGVSRNLGAPPAARNRLPAASTRVSFARVSRPHGSPLRIAFAGRMQVGKTTAADRLVAAHGFRKYALADPIKQIAGDAFGWDGGKDERGRRLLQEIGTVGRNYDPALWLRRLERRLEEDRPPRAVVDDVRLAREVDYLARLGFTVVRIARPPELIATPTSADRARHETEVELDALELPVTIDNRGTLEELFARVDALVA